MSETNVNLKISKEGLQLIAGALNKLAEAISASGSVQTPVQQPAVQAQQIPTMPYPASNAAAPQGAHYPDAMTPQQPVIQFQNHMPTLQQPAMQSQNQTPPLQQPLPTTIPTTAVAQEYTQDQLAVACAGLVNMGKQPRLMQILQSFGVTTLVEVPKERYGDLATALRTEGAVI